MFNNLQTCGNSTNASQGVFTFGQHSVNLRKRIQKLNLNENGSINEKNRSTDSGELQSSALNYSQTSKTSKLSKRTLKKRRFKEIDSAWDLSMQDGSQSVVAVHQQKEDNISDETISLSSRKGNNRRQIKFSYKKINKICAEMDVARGRSNSSTADGQAKIMGSFAILMFDLHSDGLHKMKKHD